MALTLEMDAPQHRPSNLITTSEREIVKKHDGLFTDTCNLLDHKMQGHMGIWAYLNGGRPYLESFFNSADYDGKREEQIISQVGRQFARDLPNKITLIELGPGTAFEKKTSDFIDAFNSVAGNKRIVEYQALDVVPDYANNASKYISTKYNITGSGIVCDYNKIQKPLDVLGTPVLISWNSPVWNAPVVPEVESDFIYASSLKKIGTLIGNEGIMILPHFPMMQASDTHRIYSNDDCRNAVLAIPKLIESRLSPKCFVSGQSVKFNQIFDYDVRIDEQTDYVSMDLVAHSDAEIILGEYKTVINAGERFNAVRSAKPSIRRFNNIAKTSGANIINMTQNAEGSVVVQALQFAPSIS